MIVAFIGPIGAGKSTAAQALVDRGFTKIGFADPLHEVVVSLDPIVSIDEGIVGRPVLRYSKAVETVGYRQAKDNYPEVRRLLQVMGTEVGRNQFGEDFWVDQWQRKASEHENVVVDDLRFPNEYDRIRALGGRVVLIARPGYEIPGPEAHESERHWPHFMAETMIDNTGTEEDLRRNVRALISSAVNGSDI